MATSHGTEAPLPRTYQDFANWRDNLGTSKVFNLIGFVGKQLPVEQLMNGNYQYLLELHDDLSWDGANAPGVDVKYFCKEEDKVPQAHEGDVVIIRGVKAFNVRGKDVCLTNFDTTTLVFSERPSALQSTASGLRYIAFGKHKTVVRINAEEEAYIRRLQTWAQKNTTFGGAIIQSGPAVALDQSPHNQGTPGRRSKFALLKDVGPRQFCDVVVQVIKVSPGDFVREIYVTDYTSNHLFHHHPEPGEDEGDDAAGYSGDPYGYVGHPKTPKREWPGPYGHTVLQVSLFQPHASVEISEKDYVLLRNLRMTMGNDGQYLEGKVHHDRKFVHRIDVIKLNKTVALHNENAADKLEALQVRQTEYWQELQSRDVALPPGVGQKKEQSRGAKRNMKKKRRAAALAEAEAARNAKKTKLNQTNASGKAPLHDILRPGTKTVLVRCGGPDRAETSVTDIVNLNRAFERDDLDCELPFINRTVKASIRIVDFYPPVLEDFCQWVPRQSSASRSADMSDVTLVGAEIDSSGEEQEGCWEWRFCLLVQDAQPPVGTAHQDRLKLFIGANEGDYLLKLDAADLRTDKNTLTQLRERLFILWGDLEELKAKENYDPTQTQPANRPFQCCIQEYGICKNMNEEDRDWQRCHKLHLTTISIDT